MAFDSNKEDHKVLIKKLYHNKRILNNNFQLFNDLIDNYEVLTQSNYQELQQLIEQVNEKMSNIHSITLEILQTN